MGIFSKIFGGQKEDISPKKEEQEDLDTPSPGRVMMDFQDTIQQSITWAELKSGNYAMWYPCDEDKQFTTSPIVEKWTAIYGVTKNYWSYIIADFLNTLRLTEDSPFRLDMPDELRTFAFLTTDDVEVVLSLSKEKGIRLHFAESTPFEYRLGYMDNFLGYCKAWQQMIDANGGEKDEDTGFADWWDLMVKTNREIEPMKSVKGTGIIPKG